MEAMGSTWDAALHISHYYVCYIYLQRISELSMHLLRGEHYSLVNNIGRVKNIRGENIINSE